MFSIYRNINVNQSQVSNIGGMPVPTGVSDRAETFALNRQILRSVWNGAVAKQPAGTIPATPFRAVYNASNVDSTCNYKYVYDSSVYSAFRNQSARNKTYNKLK